MDDDATDQQGRRRQREARARLSQIDSHDRRYKLLFETIDDGFSVVECLIDENDQVIDWTWLEVNRAFEHLSTLTDVVGRRASELLPSFEDNADSLTRAITTGATIRSEGDYSPGIDRWFRAHFARVGGPGSLVVAVRFEDITERKRAEIALRESEERQRLTVELVPALLWSASPDAREITLNESWSIYTGQTEANTQNYGWLDAIHPDDMPAARTAFERAFTISEPLERQYRIRKAGNGYRWHLVRHVPVRNEHEEITRWFGAAVDIHDSKLAEEALRASEERFAQFARASSAGLWIRDAQSLSMEFLSPAILNIYGVAPDAILGGSNAGRR